MQDEQWTRGQDTQSIGVWGHSFHSVLTGAGLVDMGKCCGPRLHDSPLLHRGTLIKLGGKSPDTDGGERGSGMES